MIEVGERFTYGDKQKTIGYDVNKPRNICDSLRWLNNLEIDKVIASQKLNYSILLMNFERDGNVGSVIRNSVAYISKEVAIFPRKKWNRRSGIGSEFYQEFRHIKYIEDVLAYLESFNEVVAIENNVSGAINLKEYEWRHDKNTLIVFGSESEGIPDYILEKCHKILFIETPGVLRSINVACSSAVVLNDYFCRVK